MQTSAVLTRLVMPPSRVAMVLLAGSIAFSVALDNVLLAVLLLLGLLGMGRAMLAELRGNPVARSAWLLFGMLLIATLYGATPWREALATLGKYADLALVPLFMVAASHKTTNRFAFYAFLLATAIVLIVSYSLALGLIGVQPWMWRGVLVDNPAVFHSSITQNLLTGYAVFLALLYARETQSVWKRIVFIVFALAGGANVLFLGIGRTGYLVLFALSGWFAWSTLANYFRGRDKQAGWHWAAAVVLLTVLSGWIAYHASSRLHERIDQVVSEYQAWQPNVANQSSNNTSTGERLEFYYNTLHIIREHPLIGVGTGGFQDAYARQVEGTGIVPTHNPHNEFLLLMVQAGLPALMLMFFWLYVQWREAGRLESFRRDAARGLVLTIALSCMVNSSLLDHTEGLFFAFMSALLFANYRDRIRHG